MIILFNEMKILRFIKFRIWIIEINKKKNKKFDECRLLLIFIKILESLRVIGIDGLRIFLLWVIKIN